MVIFCKPLYFLSQRAIKISLMIFLRSHCFINLYLDQIGAQAVYTWRHRESLEKSEETLKEIKHLILFNLVMIYILASFILIFVFVFCRLLHSSCRSHTCFVLQGFSLVLKLFKIGVDNWAHVSQLNFDTIH